MNNGIPSMESITDVREMRRILTDMRYGRHSPFTRSGEMSTASSLVRQCMDAGQYQGWSGEDVMTALAYHALLRLDEAQGLLMRDLVTRQPVHFVTMTCQNSNRSDCALFENKK